MLAQSRAPWLLTPELPTKVAETFFLPLAPPEGASFLMSTLQLKRAPPPTPELNLQHCPPSVISTLIVERPPCSSFKFSSLFIQSVTKYVPSARGTRWGGIC